MKEEIVISIPTDEEGYVLLKCPLCGELFKLKPDDYENDSIFNIYCPSCGLISDNYLTEDVIELAINIGKNMINEMISKELKKLERTKSSNSIKIKISSNIKRESEEPIKLTIEALEEKVYFCCKMKAKIKSILKMSGSYCPYCGEIDYGNE